MHSADADPSPRATRRESRRRALRDLARHVRELIDATVNTDVEPDQVEQVAMNVRALAARLNERRHDGPYSGLLGKGFDRQHPTRGMPLSPWAGEFNPIAPPLSIRFEDGRVVGSVRLGKQHSGPPNTAHGGVVAGILDQVLASAGHCAGTAGVTGTMKVRFRKPTPLGVQLDLVGWAEPRTIATRSRRVRAEIRHGEVVTAEGEAIVVVKPELNPREPS